MTVSRMPMASVIIVNWNGRHHLADCLDSLAKQSCDDVEVILVDNGSQDDSVAFVQEAYPRVRVVPLAENTGFARGNNIGLANARGRYIVTLNNDTLVDPNWLRTLIAVAEANPDVGMVGSRICSFHAPDRVDSLGVHVCADGMSRGAYRLESFASLALTGTMEILLPSACAALYRRDMLDQVGFFDEDFFAYCEDTDLGLRCRLAGWQALLAVDAVVLHKYSGTGGAFSPFKVYLVERNHFWVAIKNLPLSRILLLPLTTAQRLGVQLWGALLGRGTGGEFAASAAKTAVIGAICRALRDAVRSLPACWRKRREIQRTAVLPPHQLQLLLDRYRLSFGKLLDL